MGPRRPLSPEQADMMSQQFNDIEESKREIERVNEEGYLGFDVQVKNGNTITMLTQMQEEAFGGHKMTVELLEAGGYERTAFKDAQRAKAFAREKNIPESMLKTDMSGNFWIPKSIH